MKRQDKSPNYKPQLRNQPKTSRHSQSQKKKVIYYLNQNKNQTITPNNQIRIHNLLEFSHSISPSKLDQQNRYHHEQNNQSNQNFKRKNRLIKDNQLEQKSNTYYHETFIQGQSKQQCLVYSRKDHYDDKYMPQQIIRAQQNLTIDFNLKSAQLKTSVHQKKKQQGKYYYIESFNSQKDFSLGSTQINRQQNNKTKQKQKNLFRTLSIEKSIGSIQLEDKQETIDTRQPIINHTKYPYSSIGKIVAEIHNQTTSKSKNKNSKSIQNPQQKISGNNKFGMGCLIAYGIVLTAAHVVSDRQAKQTKNVKNVTFYLNHTSQADKKNKRNNILKFKVKRILIHPQYFSKSKSQSQRHDIAILILQQSQNLPKQCLSIKYDYDFKNNPTKKLKFITSKELKFITSKEKSQNFYQLWQSNDLPQSMHQDLLLYKNTTSSGDSGSPILFCKKFNGQIMFYVVGIHIGSMPKQNCGILFNSFKKSTKDIFSEIIQQNQLATRLQKVKNYQLSSEKILLNLNHLLQLNPSLSKKLPHKMQQIQIPKKQFDQQMLIKRIQQLQNANSSQQAQINEQKDKIIQLLAKINEQNDKMIQLISQLKQKERRQKRFHDYLRNNFIKYKQKLAEIKQHKQTQHSNQLYNTKNKLSQLQDIIEQMNQKNDKLIQENKEKQNKILELQAKCNLRSQCAIEEKQISQVDKSEVNLTINIEDINNIPKTEQGSSQTKRVLMNDESKSIKQQENDKSCINKLYQSILNLFSSKPKISPTNLNNSISQQPNQTIMKLNHNRKKQQQHQQQINKIKQRGTFKKSSSSIY